MYFILYITGATFILHVLPFYITLGSLASCEAVIYLFLFVQAVLKPSAIIPCVMMRQVLLLIIYVHPL